MNQAVLRDLLAKGFFPRDIPSIFSGAKFSEARNQISANFLSNRLWTSSESFSFPHSMGGRRIASMVNPLPFFRLCSLIAQNWSQIKEVGRKSKLSFSRTIVGNGERAIRPSNFDGFREAQIIRGSGYSFVLRADFARFFPTIYTHSLEWAIRGKDESKANLRLPRNQRTSHWGAEVDQAIQCMQDGQTQGVPIGPDTSWIVAELLCCAIDSKMQDLFSESLVGARMVDDYVLYFSSREKAERAHSVLIAAAAEYGVALNELKTSIESLTQSVQKSWVYDLRVYGQDLQSDPTRHQVLRLTDAAVRLCLETRDTAVVRYAIRQLSAAVIHHNDIDIAIASVLRLAILDSSSIFLVARFLIGYHNAHYSYNRSPIRVFIESVLTQSISLGHHYEATWCLWLAINLRIRLGDNIVEQIGKSSSSAMILLTRVAHSRRLCKLVKQSVLSDRLCAEDFKSSAWLLAYEGAMRGWFGWRKNEISGSCLEPLASEDVFFLDLHVMEKGAVRLRPSAAIPTTGESAVQTWLKGMTLTQLRHAIVPVPIVDGYGVDAAAAEVSEEEGEQSS